MCNLNNAIKSENISSPVILEPIKEQKKQWSDECRLLSLS